MLERLKVLLLGTSVIILLFIALRVGDGSGPDISIDTNFESVSSDVEKNTGLEDEKGFVQKRSYIPAYSHIYVSSGDTIELAVTLSLRNTDSARSLNILGVYYYNTSGKLIRKYLKDGQKLPPLATKEVFVKTKDIEGGSGANFIVEFATHPSASEPIFESIMTSAAMNSFIFKSRGVIQ